MSVAQCNIFGLDYRYSVRWVHVIYTYQICICNYTEFGTYQERKPCK